MTNKLNIIGLVVSILAVTVAIYTHSAKNSIAYVNVAEVYSEFELSKELQEKYKKSAMVRNTILDSLRFSIDVLTKQIEKTTSSKSKQNLIEKYNAKASEYQVREQQLAEDNKQQNQTYKEQIQTQLNQYITDFGKDKDYDLIFGANGSGVMLYASDGKNVTAELIEYVNNKYSGL